MPRSKRPAFKRRFTELTVRKLAPKGDAYLVWDSLQRGLAIRVRPTGHKAFKGGLFPPGPPALAALRQR
jgi:hypothetical protein